MLPAGQGCAVSGGPGHYVCHWGSGTVSHQYGGAGGAQAPLSSLRCHAAMGCPSIIKKIGP